jgi:hypothetical protein
MRRGPRPYMTYMPSATTLARSTAGITLHSCTGAAVREQMLDIVCKVPYCIRCIQAADRRLALTAAAPAPPKTWLGSRCDPCSAGYWVRLDDDKAPELVPERDIMTPEAYLLFYKRRPEAQRDDGALFVQHMPAQCQGSCTFRGLKGLGCWTRQSQLQ